MKNYSAIIVGDTATIYCKEGDEAIYAVRYTSLSEEEINDIDGMTSEDLRHYLNRNYGEVIR